jgi:hypothetical protein
VRERGLALAAFAAYAVGALVVTWPLALHVGDHAVGHVEREATPPLNTWAMSVVQHQLRHDPAHLFDGNAFHPYTRTLTFSEHLFVPALAGAPVVAVTGNRALAYNVVLLLTLAVAGLGGCLLSYEVTLSRAGAFLGGIVYAFHTWNLNEMVRLQILSNEWFPFVLWSLLRFFARPSGRRAAAVGVFYALQSLSCMYYALYLPLLVGPVVLFLQWRRRLAWGEGLRLAFALVPALAFTAVFAVPYARAARELGFVRPAPESVGLDRWLDVLPGNLLWGGVLGTAGPNQNAAHFLGFSVFALVLIGAIQGTMAGEPRGQRALWIALGAAGLLLSLGPEIRVGERVLGPGPYAFLFRFVPGFRNVRYPERFAVFVALAAAPLAAAGLAALRSRLRAVGAAAVCAIAFLENLALPNVLTPMPSGDEIHAVYRRLAERTDVHVVAEFPAARHRMERLDAMPMYLSTVHWKRTLEGFTSYFPPTYNFAKWRLFHFPDPESVTFLQRFGVDTVVVRAEQAWQPRWRESDPRWTMEGPLPGGDLLLRLRGPGDEPFTPPATTSRREVPRAGWDVQASYSGAGRAVDGDLQTAWTTGERQGRGDFYRVRFPAPVTVARISVAVRAPYEFPMHVKVLGQAENDWVELPFVERDAYDDLFTQLRHRPQDAWLHLDVTPRRVQAVRLRITETDPFWMPWTAAEIKVYAASE